MEAVSSHPASTAASYTVSCASDHEESTFLKRNHHLRWAQLALSVVCFGFALAIVGCEAVPFEHYRSTSGYEEAGLALWPLNFDLRPTIAILSSGCVIAVLNLIYIVAVLVPSPRSHIRRLNILASGTAIAGLIAAAAGVGFASYLPQSTYPSGFSHNETLHSWTCKWKAMPSVTSSENASLHAPTHFERDCRETQAGFVLLALLIGLEVVGGAVGVFGVWLERSVSRQRSYEVQVEKWKRTTSYTIGKKIECYLDCVSPYSFYAFTYLQQNADALASLGVEIEYTPVFLGGINVGSGNKPPWTLPAKAAYTTYDGKRAQKYFGHDFEVPAFFPILSLLPQRALTYIKRQHAYRLITAFRACFETMWNGHLDISKPDNLAKALGRTFSGAEVEEILAAASSPEIKKELTATTARVVNELGAFGCPWFWVTNGDGRSEPFFGSDRFHFMWDFLELPHEDLRLKVEGKARL